MPEREVEPIFCSECQNEVRSKDARVLRGKVLCPTDLKKRGFLERIMARKLPEDATRRGGVIFRGMFTPLAALMLVVGVALVWRSHTIPVTEGLGESTRLAEFMWERLDRVTGVWMIVASGFVAIFGLLAGDAVDVLLDIYYELRRLNRR